MPITEIRQYTRPSTDVTFFTEVTKPAEFVAAQDEALASGALTRVASLSEDELNQTITITYETLDAMSIIETASSISMYALWLEHLASSGMTVAGRFTQTGVDAPFTQTSTWSFPAESELVTSIATFVSTLASTKLTSQVATPTSVTVVHTYANSADYTSNKFSDFGFLNTQTAALIAAGCVRTIAYAMV